MEYLWDTPAEVSWGKTYHGERTEHGCVVTVDGRPLRMRSDLSGNATTAFDWGYIGGGQLSLALLSDFFGSNRKARAMSEVFEQHVIAGLPVESWTLTEDALATALAPLAGVEDARADDVEAGGDAGAAFRRHARGGHKIIICDSRCRTFVPLHLPQQEPRDQQS